MADQNNTANVSVGKGKVGGYCFTAPAGTSLPSDASTALAGAYVNLGYISEDGLTNSISTDSSEIKDWNGDTILTVISSRTETFQFTLVETKVDVLKEVFGASNVTEAGGKVTVKSNNSAYPIKPYVFEVVLTGNRIERIVLPAGQITELGDMSYQAGEAIGYEITVTGTPDSSGNTSYRYIETVGGGSQ